MGFRQVAPFRLASICYTVLVLAAPITALVLGIRSVEPAWDRALLEALFNSLWIAGMTATAATLAGSLAAVLVTKTDWRSKQVWIAFLVAPIFFVPYQVALAWSSALKTSSLASVLFSQYGAVFVMASCFYPVPFWLVHVALKSVPPEEEEAALMVAGPWRVLLRVTLPKVLPAAAASFFLTYLLALCELGVPTYLGVPVLPYKVMVAFSTRYQLADALSSALPMGLIGMLLLGVDWHLLRQSALYYQETPRREGGLLFVTKRWWTKAAAKLATGGLICVSIVVPTAVLAAQAMSIEALKWIAATALPSLARSLALATASGLIAAGWAVVDLFSRQGRPGTLESLLALTVFFLPPPLLATGIIWAWSRTPAWLPVYGTWLILLLGLVARFSFIAYKVMETGFKAINRSAWEAGVMVERSPFKVFSKVVFPSVKRWFAAGALLVFILAVNELGLSIMLYPPDGEPLTVRLYTHSINTPISHQAALALLGSTAGFLLLAVMVLRKVSE